MTAPLLLFAHGAGLGKDSPWMRRWADHLATIGSVVTFDYPYMRAGRRSPDKPAVLLEAHREAFDAAIDRYGARPVVLVGKSMGSRMGCHLATDPEVAPRVSALVCLGYPLVGASKKAPLRDEVLRALQTPVLFVQGTRDPLCPLDRLAEVRPRMQAPNELFVVDGGDHSLVVRKGDLARRQTTQDAVEAAVLGAIADFVERHARATDP